MRRVPMMAFIVGGYLLFRFWNGDIIPLIVLGVIAVAGVMIFRAYQSRSNRVRADKVEHADVEAGTETVSNKLADTANRILDVEARPGLDLSSEATDYFQKAVGTFVSVDERFPDAVSSYQIEGLVRELEDALWRLDAAEAILDGRDVPATPQASAPSVTRQDSSGSLNSRTRQTVTRWVGDDNNGGHRRRRRSC